MKDSRSGNRWPLHCVYIPIACTVARHVSVLYDSSDQAGDCVEAWRHTHVLHF